MIRLANVEGSGWTLDVFSDVTAYRAVVKDADDVTVFAAVGAELAGAGGAFESVRTYFAAQRLDHVGAALVTEAEAEVRASGGVDLRPPVPGWDVAEAILRGIEELHDRHPDISRQELEHAAAAGAVRVKLEYDVREKGDAT